MATLRIQSILFHNETQAIERTLDCIQRAADLAIAQGCFSAVQVAYGDCSPAALFDDETIARLQAAHADYFSLDVTHFDANLGSAKGHNTLLQASEADYVLIMNPDVVLAPNGDGDDYVLKLLVPLRHVAWGANMNGAYQCAYGYGTAITQPCLYAGMDQLGIAQYLTRLGLLLGTPGELEAGKQAWLEAPAWQPLRRLVEDTWVMKDWFELYVAQNVVLDGVLFGLAYKEVDQALSERAGPVVSMLTRFQAEWAQDANKWVDAVMKVAAAESPENKALLSEWYAHWRARVQEALAPVAALGLGSDGAQALERALAAVDARMNKAGLSLAA